MSRNYVWMFLQQQFVKFLCVAKERVNLWSSSLYDVSVCVCLFFVCVCVSLCVCVYMCVCVYLSVCLCVSAQSLSLLIQCICFTHLISPCTLYLLSLPLNFLVINGFNFLPKLYKRWYPFLISVWLMINFFHEVISGLNN